MNSDGNGSASARLEAARSAESEAATALEAARGTDGHLHAAVQLRAAEDQVEARTAWLAWTELGDESG